MSEDLLSAVNSHFVSLTASRIQGGVSERKYLQEMFPCLELLDSIQEYSKAARQQANPASKSHRLCVMPRLPYYCAESIETWAGLLCTQSQLLHIRGGGALYDRDVRTKLCTASLNYQSAFEKVIENQNSGVKLLAGRYKFSEGLEQKLFQKRLQEAICLFSTLDSVLHRHEKRLLSNAVLETVKDARSRIAQYIKSYNSVLIASRE